MSTPQFSYPGGPAPAPQGGGSNLKTALAAGAIVASLAANGFLMYQMNQIKTENVVQQGKIQKEIDTIVESSTQMTAAQRKNLTELKEDLDTRSRQLSQQASLAKKEALTYADQQAQKLEAEQRQAVATVNENVSKVGADVSDVRQRADAANAKVADVGADVSGVKTDLSSTKNDLQQARLDLKKVTGDLGLTSGLVATNGKEIDELRRRGERNIIEFHINKTKDFQKVGDISVQLKKSDPKSNKFTLELLADDKRSERKDRNVNEPVQFYVSKSLYELVVNTVGKDTVSGYLSTPKYQARNN
jgi:hypothetical protein